MWGVDSMDDRKRPLFMIGVVCEMFHIHPQTLRIYEKEGLIHPQRVGGARRYSAEDIERIRVIMNLTRDLGVNRAGVDIILRMRQRLESLHQEMNEMMDYLESGMRDRFQVRLKEIFEEEEKE
jgi:MerR family transcriptional regulator/heat shock protein HspR